MPETSVIFRVLIADDEKIIADTLALILNLNGFEAAAVYSGEQAVETARTLRPDALISDICMAKMSGIDAALHIQRFVPDCEVLLISGLAGDEMLSQVAAQHPEFVVFEKPLDPRALIEMLKALSASKTTGGTHTRLAPDRARRVFHEARTSLSFHSDSCLSRVGSCSALRASAY
jgi:DNA-binding NtrC family response regulator